MLHGGHHIILYAMELFDELEEHLIHTIDFGDQPHGTHLRPRTISLSCALNLGLKFSGSRY